MKHMRACLVKSYELWRWSLVGRIQFWRSNRIGDTSAPIGVLVPAADHERDMVLQ